MYATTGRFGQQNYPYTPITVCDGVGTLIQIQLYVCSEFESLQVILNEENTMTMVCEYETASCMQLRWS